MRRYFLLPCLMLLLWAITGSTWTGNPERFKYGNVQLDTVTSLIGDADLGYCAIQIKDANSDGDLDPTDGLFLVDDDGNEYGPFLYSGGGGVAPTDATYLVQTANGSLSAEQAMGALATGLVKNATTTGIQSIAVQGTDYYAPGGTDVAVADGGTGASTLTGLLTGNGTSAITGYNSFTDNHMPRANGTGAMEDTAWEVADSGSGSMMTLDLGNPSSTLGAGFLFMEQSGASTSLYTKLTSDANNRFSMLTSGQMQWGSGSATEDTVVSRVSASKLGMASGDAFRAGEYLELAEASSPSPSAGFGQISQSANQSLILTDEAGNQRAAKGALKVGASAADTITHSVNPITQADFASKYAMPALTVTSDNDISFDFFISGKFNTAALAPAAVNFFLEVGDTPVCTFSLPALATALTGGTFCIQGTMTALTHGATGTMRGSGLISIFDGATYTTRISSQSTAATLDFTGALDVELELQMIGNQDVATLFTVEQFILTKN